MIQKKTKVICTIGPSSWDPKVMEQLINSGMNCARVNGAFADEAELDKVTNLVRSVSSEVSLMMDVKGPEVRLNKFQSAKPIKPGDKIVIGNSPDSEIYPANYKNLYKSLSIGQRMVIGDGDVELNLVGIDGDKMECIVEFGETLKPGKALNLPGADIATSALTERDVINLQHSIKLGWDFVSASFIQNSESALFVKNYLKDSEMKLIAKIEDQKGVDNIEEILEVVDGIMIARGGLGVELGLEKVPFIQRYLVKKATDAGKVVITATQMLESMSYNPRPTRAEVNDVATAILLGSDAVMLSGESSAGLYPVESVKEMSKIALETEQYIEPEINKTRTNGPITTDALSNAVAQMAIDLRDEIKCIVVVSKSGRTARLISRNKVRQPIFAFVSSEAKVRELSISRGIERAFHLGNSSKTRDRDESVLKLKEMIIENAVASKGDKVLLVCKTPIDESEFFPNIVEVIKI